MATAPDPALASATPAPPQDDGHPVPSGPDLLARIAALLADPSVDSSGADKLRNLLPKLRSAPDAPAERWLTLGQALHVGLLKGRPDAPPAAHQAALDALARGWQGVPLAQRLATPQITVALQSEAALGRSDTLVALLEHHLYTLLQPAHAPVFRQCLRLLRRLHAWRPLPPLLQRLALDWQADCSWRMELLHAVAMLAQYAEDPDALDSAAQWLERFAPMIDSAALDDDRVPALSALGTLAVRTVHLPLLRRLARVLVAEAPADKLEGTLNSVFACLAHFEHDAEVATLLDRGVAWLPRSPALHQERARWAFSRGADEATVTAMLDDVDPTHPSYRRAMLWMATTLFYQGSADQAERFYLRADAAEPLTGADRARLGHVQVRAHEATVSTANASDTAAATPAEADSGTDARPAADIDSSTAPCDDDDGDVAALAALLSLDAEPFRPALTPLVRLMAIEPTHAGLPLAALRQRAEAAEQDCRARLARLPEAAIDDTVLLARTLWQLAQQRYQHLSDSLAAFPLAWGPAYGSLDPRRGQVLFHAVLAHLASVVAHALARPAPFSRRDGNLRGWLELLRFGCDAHLAQGQVAAAQALVQGARQRLGPRLGAAVVAVLDERTLLAAGRLAEATAVRRQMAVDADADVLPLQPWARWVAQEQLATQRLVDDAALAGHFESVLGNGEVVRHAHATVPVRVDSALAQGLTVRLAHALQGPQAGLLLPHPWHLTMGDYPYAHADVLNRAAGAATLRAARTTRRVKEPVLVLANMDATVHRNFYHWMLLILSRVGLALEAGCLNDRRLLVPEDLSGWMRSSLVDAGLPADRLLAYGRDEALTLHDVLLISPLEFASPTVAEHLRCRLWRAAGLDPAAPPPAERLLFVTRRSENRRPLVSEARIVEAAEALGFEVVAPETLSLLDQVRLFASARGVAGPPGAAFTNLLWCAAGTRVLSIFKEDVNLPTFIDLSILRGQSHRWLLGSNLPGFERASTLNAPYDVDVELARRELAWVARA